MNLKHGLALVIATVLLLIGFYFLISQIDLRGISWSPTETSSTETSSTETSSTETEIIQQTIQKIESGNYDFGDPDETGSDQDAWYLSKNIRIQRSKTEDFEFGINYGDDDLSGFVYTDIRLYQAETKASRKWELIFRKKSSRRLSNEHEYQHEAPASEPRMPH